MKVTTNTEGESAEIKYPCLMIVGNSDGTIVLKTSLTSGTVMRAGGSWKVGDHYNSWGKHFKPFTGPITLEND